MKQITEPHAITRARERYGLALTILDLVRIQRQIEEGKSALMAKLSPERERHIVEINGCAMIAIYHVKSGHIMTVEPRERTSTPKKLKRKNVLRRNGRRQRNKPCI